jgi:hypothetical protein
MIYFGSVDSMHSFTKSDNFDRKIESYKAGADALYEPQRIKEEIRIIEHDL